MIAELAAMLGALVAGTLIALAAGATNLGTALTFGMLAFVGVVIWVLLRRP